MLVDKEGEDGSFYAWAILWNLDEHFGDSDCWTVVAHHDSVKLDVVLNSESHIRISHTTKD